ncbi:MAG: hypothetical protein J6R21_05840 [Bacteroidales bacterium]|nr:hypothetical protein [Bacteroidales bacterium]
MSGQATSAMLPQASDKRQVQCCCKRATSDKRNAAASEQQARFKCNAAASEQQARFKRNAAASAAGIIKQQKTDPMIEVGFFMLCKA